MVVVRSDLECVAKLQLIDTVDECTPYRGREEEEKFLSSISSFQAGPGGVDDETCRATNKQHTGKYCLVPCSR